MTQTHHVNRVIHQLVDFGPLESRLAAVPHDFGVGSCDKTHLNGRKTANIIYHESETEGSLKIPSSPQDLIWRKAQFNTDLNCTLDELYRRLKPKVHRDLWRSHHACSCDGVEDSDLRR